MGFEMKILILKKKKTKAIYKYIVIRFVRCCCFVFLFISFILKCILKILILRKYYDYMGCSNSSDFFADLMVKFDKYEGS